MEDLSVRLQNALNIRGIKPSELSEKTGIDKGAISRYLSNKYKPKYNAISKLALALNVQPAWLMGYDVPMETPVRPMNAAPITDSLRIPLLGKVAAGEPLFDEGNIIGEVMVDPDLAKGGANLYALKVRGNSMEPKIMDGDTLIVREQPDADDDEIVIVTVNGDEGTCKKIKHYPDSLALISINTIYDPIYYTWEEVEQLPVRVVGKVIQARHDF